MTAGGDFIPVDDFDSDQPNYPVVFGIRLTPTVNGILLALVGAGVATWLLLNVVKPAWDANQAIRQEIETSRQQLVDQAEIQKQIEQARQDLAEAEELRADVLALFADEESLETLLIDLNARVQGAEVASPAIEVGEVQTGGAAVLERFSRVSPAGDAAAPAAPGGDVVNDGSFGAAVNGKLRQQVYDVQINGTFGQTQSIIRNIERLRPLLVVQDLQMQPANRGLLLVNERGQIQPLGDPRLQTSFKLIALLPPEEEAAGAAGTPASPTPPAAAPSPPAAPAPAAP